MVLFCSSLAYGSQTITATSRGNICPRSTVEGKVTTVDIETGDITIQTLKGETKVLKAVETTSFRIPGMNKDQLKNNSAVTKAITNAEAKVQYCTKDSTVTELKVTK